MKTCAVIPAAGRGTRLGLNLPKLLLPLNKNETVWSILRKKLVSLVDHINIIISPIQENLFRKTLNADIACGLVSLSIQPEPIGMGDAIFCGYPIWSHAEKILIIWGDQVFVSENTLRQTLTLHHCKEKTIVLPLVKKNNLYVEYVFSENTKLVSVKQTREGETCGSSGFSDVGTFLLSVPYLESEWKMFLLKSHYGTQTNEINFLPFLPFLSQHSWQVHSFEVKNALESRGINTPEDFIFLKNLYSGIVS